MNIVAAVLSVLNNIEWKLTFQSQSIFCRSLLINRTLLNCNEFHKGNSTFADLKASKVQFG